MRPGRSSLSALSLARVLFFLTLLTLSASAQPAGDLGLSREQAAHLNQIRTEYTHQRKTVQNSLRSRKHELMELLKATEPQSGDIKQKLTQIMDLELKLQHLYVDEMFHCREAMSEGQWMKYRRNVVRLMTE